MKKYASMSQWMIKRKEILSLFKNLCVFFIINEYILTVTYF